ncbi:hypothetical protein [Pontibacter actiniarum]|uniref:Uncharacterized protein n=1 Tax=Pontibacter actiniarum TaxID=323450 RepID=A0A1X9YX42_9BACT|nr:hypothetical protein [Pontibacter actiniarum]ARS37497.1 hypothetical protein CA264_19855 [Pontibacter actiniarum]
MKEEEKEAIRKEILRVQGKLDSLVAQLEDGAEKASEDDEDVVRNEDIPTVYIDTTPGQEEE